MVYIYYQRENSLLSYSKNENILKVKAVTLVFIAHIPRDPMLIAA